MASTSNTTAGDDAKGTYLYEYPRPAVTADNVIFGFDGDRLQILLVERGLEPYKGCWALPGGFMRINETIDQCARRELKRRQTSATYISSNSTSSATPGAIRADA